MKKEGIKNAVISLFLCIEKNNHTNNIIFFNHLRCWFMMAD